MQTKRLCVSKCPKAGDTKLDCYPTEKLACSANTNPDFEVQIYDSEQEISTHAFTQTGSAASACPRTQP